MKAQRPRIVKKAKEPTWVAMGFDISMSSVSGAARGWDKLLRRHMGPVFVQVRWSKDEDYFKRLATLARPEVLIHDLIGQLKMTPKLEEIHIAMEEPFPFGMVKRGAVSWIKQQAQFTGGFLAGAARYGYANIYEINNVSWKRLVATELGTKTSDSQLKFKTKDWAMQKYEGVPDWPHLIKHNKLGIIPQPETSRARPYQPDDRYDALGIENWIEDGIRTGEIELVIAGKKPAAIPQVPV